MHRSLLGERLRRRRAEIEQTILARVYSVSDPTDGGDPEYVAGLRAAVAAAVSYGLSAVEGEREGATPVPSALFAQARHAARTGVSLDTVLRRYFAGYTLLGEYLMQEAEEGEQLEAEEIHRLSRAQAALFDRLVVAVADEYRREIDRRSDAIEHPRAERVRRLLAGELVDAHELGYELGARWHLGAIAAGPGARAAVRELAAALDRQLLLVDGGAGTVWAWLGGRKKIAAAEALLLASSNWPPEVSLALGEAGEGIGGWRLTHRQAKVTIPIALRGTPSLVRYADVALLAAALGDEVLAGSLREAYLAPLEDEHDDGASLRKTLRAYFAAGRNLSSAAAVLGVSRQTVRNRLSMTEERVGSSLDNCGAEMETALRLWELEVAPASNRHSK